MQWAASDPPRSSNYGMQSASNENPGPCVVEPIPGPSRGFAPGTLRQHAGAQVPDSTSIGIATIYDGENVRDWDRIRVNIKRICSGLAVRFAVRVLIFIVLFF